MLVYQRVTIKRIMVKFDHSWEKPPAAYQIFKGFPKLGEAQNGWFRNGKVLLKFGWWLGVPPPFMETPYTSDLLAGDFAMPLGGSYSQKSPLHRSFPPCPQVITFTSSKHAKNYGHPYFSLGRSTFVVDIDKRLQQQVFHNEFQPTYANLEPTWQMTPWIVAAKARGVYPIASHA